MNSPKSFSVLVPLSLYNLTKNAVLPDVDCTLNLTKQLITTGCNSDVVVIVCDKPDADSLCKVDPDTPVVDVSVAVVIALHALVLVALHALGWSAG